MNLQCGLLKTLRIGSEILVRFDLDLGVSAVSIVGTVPKEAKYLEFTDTTKTQADAAKPKSLKTIISHEGKGNND